MREIKFRAWNNLIARMYPVHAIDFEDTEGWNVKIDSNTYADFENVEVMQYTGLKDKNGTEVFEGDIVKFCVAWGEPDEEDTKDPAKWLTREIKFKNGSFAPVIHGDAGIAGLEVIGNMHESPELLDKPS